MKKIFIVSGILLLISSNAYSWDGYDYKNGSSIEIGKGNLVREGETIEVYDYGRGRYIDYDVTDFSGNEIEVENPDTGEIRTFEMDD